MNRARDFARRHVRAALGLEGVAVLLARKEENIDLGLGSADIIFSCWAFSKWARIDGRADCAAVRRFGYGSRPRKTLVDRYGLRVRQFLLTSIGLIKIRPSKALQAA